MNELLTELLKTIEVIAEKAWSLIQNLYTWLESLVGAPAAFAVTAFLLVLVPYLLLNMLFSKTQSAIERGQAGLSGMALKALAVALTMFFLLFVLSR